MTTPKATAGPRRQGVRTASSRDSRAVGEGTASGAGAAAQPGRTPCRPQRRLRRRGLGGRSSPAVAVGYPSRAVRIL